MREPGHGGSLVPVTRASGVSVTYCRPRPDGGAKEPRTSLGPAVAQDQAALSQPCAGDPAVLLTTTVAVTATLY